MKRRHFLRNGLWVMAGALGCPAIIKGALLSGRRIVSPVILGSSVVDPLTDPNIWAFWRSDMGITTESTEGDSLNHLKSWTDQTGQTTSGFDRNLNVNVSNNGPVVTTNDLNGHPTVWAKTTSPSNNYFVSNGNVTLAQPYSIFQLIRFTSLAANNYIIDSFNGSGNSGALLSADGSTLLMYSGNLGPNIAAPANGVWAIVSSIWDGASSSIQINNGTAATGNVGGTGGTGLGFNGFGNLSNVNKTDFKMAACIITKVHASSTWIANHKNWLANYGGLTI